MKRVDLEAIKDSWKEAMKNPIAREIRSVREVLDLIAEVEALREMEKAARDYKQAILDHSKDPCQCWNGLCLGNCGPTNARKLLEALAKLPPLEKP